MKKVVWLLWILLCAVLLGFYGYKMFYSTEKNEFLIGEASHGHFQIEMACTACHSEAFGGRDILQDACVACHGQELERAHDSHPVKKFTDPRNAERLEILDARYCITCHVEHQREQTREMGVTLPNDYCYHCHEGVGEERESHKGLAFDSCASAGCHNYHDNRALYEDFLVENAGGRWVKEVTKILKPNANDLIDLAIIPDHFKAHPVLTEKEVQERFPEEFSAWEHSGHGSSGVNCQACHGIEGAENWIEKPGMDQCRQCHNQEVEGFLLGKHGMRLSQNLQAMSPGQTSSLSFSSASAHSKLNCNSCHKAHKFDTEFAKQDACLSCHNDEHSLAFENSPHGRLLSSEDNMNVQETGVSCATCHMPRLEILMNGEKVVAVQHNQNENLRPNEKMIRTVCMSCHNLEFSIDALADEELINNNFSGKPKEHVPSIDWAKKRVKTN